MGILEWVLAISIFLLVLCISVGIHEGFHMITAKMFHIPVPKFFIGFGKTLWSKKYNGTEYGFKLLPLGGFVSIEDVNSPEGSPERELLSNINPWKRIPIFIAGAISNLILGGIILFCTYWSTPTITGGNIVEQVNTCHTISQNCAADKAGLKSGDKIVKIDGHSVKGLDDPNFRFNSNGSIVTVLRGSSTLKDLKVTPSSAGTIGVTMNEIDHDRSLSQTFSDVGSLYSDSFKSIGKIPGQIQPLYDAIIGSDKRSINSVSSVIGVGQVYGDTVTDHSTTMGDKVRLLAYYSGMINIGLGVLNLLPLLPLDGGRVFIALIDVVRGWFSRIRHKEYKPLSAQIIGYMTAAMGIVVFSFMLLVIVADIVSPISL